MGFRTFVQTDGRLSYALFLAVCVLLLVTAPRRSVSAAEGMWLFNDPPRKLIQKEFGFELTDSFLDHLRYASVRFSNGGSGSFVSPDGLVMTNHHIAESSLQKLGSEGNNLTEKGFYAETLEKERSCPDLELVMLEEIEDVTTRVNGVVKPGMSFEAAEEARRGAMNLIEKESLAKTGLKSDVVTLFQGGRYHLYRYKTFNDVRIVFAPEASVGFFGGEPDNFEYPRYNLDVAFFRAYVDGKPYRPRHWLKWNSEGVREGELVFVSGHPGRTNRFETMDHLIFRRDFHFPYQLNKLRRREVLLQSYSERNLENARRVSSTLFRIKNSRKNYTGVLLGLQTPAWLERLDAVEKSLVAEAKEKKLVDLEKYNPWKEIHTALSHLYELFYMYQLIEQGDAFHSRIYEIARGIVRYTAENAKPNEKRLREYRETELDGIRNMILSETPIYKDLERVTLTDSLGFYLDSLSDWEYDSAESNGFVFLNGRSPKEQAAALVDGSKLDDIKVRQALLDGGWDTVRKSKDPMIVFALHVDKTAREVRRMYDATVAEPMRQAYSRLARLRFELARESTYPDATFSLRLSYGKVAGYKDDDGSIRPAWTSINGLFERARLFRFTYPYNLPQRWNNAKDLLDLDTPMNLVTTNDIIGGNSGSPLVNARGEVIGLIFDGNIQSLAANFIYTQEQARAISVHAAAILEGLNKVYRAGRIVNELTPH